MPKRESRLCLIGKSEELQAGLIRSGFVCTAVADGEEAPRQIAEQAPDLVLIAVNGRHETGTRELIQTIKQDKLRPVMVMAGREALDRITPTLNLVDDFVVQPCQVDEVALRIRRLLQREGDNRDLIKRGNLVIDTARCEVTVGDKAVEFTFREYELLRFLASNEGRVFSRDALLDRVWGYDYYGGDRTVDVHVRRLRSKIEDADHTFIETVRNIGYRFKGDS